MRRFLLSALLTLAVAAGLGLAPAFADPAGPMVPVKKSKKAKKAKTGIHWTIAPSTVEVYVDNKRLGVAEGLDVTRVKAGRHTVRLVHGEDETEFDVLVKKGQILQLRYEFTDA